MAMKTVKTYKYPDSIIDNKLNGNANIEKVYEKTNQRMYFINKLMKCSIDKSIISMFYKTAVESILNLCFLNWFGSSSPEARSKVKRIVTSAGKTWLFCP